ncbi:hypothetical protein [Snodgrassella sp. CFCC 13594]|uniref:hypothetical protein n=1 Tax=Snodgrassella sp. CFCC 13594 TaxID=1775559 RepID=UPI0008322E25|nr:hypothetical protein [Snodgrassella sp. CFCC 13594]
MGIIKKIVERKRQQSQVTDFTQPEEHQEPLSDIVKDEDVEMGLPLNDPGAKKSNMSKVAMLGVGLVAVGAIVAGVIGFASGGDETTVAAASDPTAGVKNMNPNDFNADKDKLALEQAMATSAPASASEPGVGEVDSTESVATADAAPAPTDAPTQTASTEPVLTPGQINRNRRLGGEVILPVAQNAVLGADSGGQATTVADDGSSSNPGGFAGKLNPTNTASAKATQRGDLSCY